MPLPTVRQLRNAFLLLPVFLLGFTGFLSAAGVLGSILERQALFMLAVIPSLALAMAMDVLLLLRARDVEPEDPRVAVINGAGEV